MPRLSAGLLMYRIRDGAIQVLLAHPGGPYFVNKDDGHWSIPKGEPGPDEDLLLTAQREFEEKTGLKPAGPFVPLQPVKQKGGKVVSRLGLRWRLRSDHDPQQHIHHGMAATVGPAEAVPGDRPGRVLRLGDGSKENQVRAGGADRRTGGGREREMIGRAFHRAGNFLAWTGFRSNSPGLAVGSKTSWTGLEPKRTVR